MSATIHPHRRRGSWLLLVTLLTACAAPRVAPLPAPDAAFNPAGDWEYVERGQSVLLSLDEQGNGRYDWRDGQIVTTAIEGSTWTGIWRQPGNDREGGFELTLSGDRQRADGRWWYTRIGDDQAPQKKGGRFSLIRLSPARLDQSDAGDR